MNIHATRRPFATPAPRAGLIRETGFVLITSMILLAVLMMVGMTAMQNSNMGQKVITNAAQTSKTREGSEWSRSIINDVITNHFNNAGWPPPYGTSAAFVGTTFPPANFFVRSTTATPGNCVLIGNGAAGTFGNVVLQTTDASGALIYNNKIPTLASSILDYSCPDARIVVDPSGNNTAPITTNIYVVQLGSGLATGAATAMVAGYEGTGKGAAGGGGGLYLDIRACSSMDATIGGQCRSTTSATATTGVQYRLVIR